MKNEKTLSEKIDELAVQAREENVPLSVIAIINNSHYTWTISDKPLTVSNIISVIEELDNLNNYDSLLILDAVMEHFK